MKKMKVFALLSIMSLVLAACGNASKEGASGPEEAVTGKASEPVSELDSKAVPEGGESVEGADEKSDSEWKWDNKIEIMVPAAAGGGLDVTLRALQPYLEEALGTNIVIDCRSGGSGVTGYTYSYNGTPRDGYYFQFTAPTAIFSAAAGKFDVDMWDSLVAVSGCVQAEGVIFANPKTSFSNLEELISYAKEHPGQVSIAIDAPTGNSGVLTALFEEGTGIKFKWVTGGADEAVISTIAGETDLLLATWSETSAYVESGDVVPIVFLSNERNPIAPDVPCSAEVGTEIDLGYARMFTCMEGTPQEAIDAFEAAVHQACTSKGWEKWLKENGFVNKYLWDQAETAEVLNDFFTLGRGLLSGNAGN